LAASLATNLKDAILPSPFTLADTQRVTVKADEISFHTPFTTMMNGETW